MGVSIPAVLYKLYHRPQKCGLSTVVERRVMSSERVREDWAEPAPPPAPGPGVIGSWGQGPRGVGGGRSQYPLELLHFDDQSVGLLIDTQSFDLVSN